MVALAERLLGRGFELMIYDQNVAFSRLLGANRAYVDSRIPHLSKLHGELGRRRGEPRRGVRRRAPPIRTRSRPSAAWTTASIVDLVRFPGSDAYEGRSNYIGVGW